MRSKKLLCMLIFVVFALSIFGCGTAKVPQTTPAPVKDVILATTTSTQDSGLLDVLIPEFEKKTGYKVKTIAVGTGQALEMGKKGEADVLLVHAPAEEKKLVDTGLGINYQLVMHNDFILVGPESDPAKVKGVKTCAEALKKIADTGSLFISRGDKSGTHTKELALWKSAGIEQPKTTKAYQETGQGMGQTLNVASEKQGYTLTDRATFLAHKKNLKLAILVEGEKNLLNIYHVMQVNPEKFPKEVSSKMNPAGAKAFVEFMVDPETQKLIGQFGVDKYGQPLFIPDAGKKEEDLGK